ncbi:hypothetical protein [Mangrovimonas futianensis]|uniref:hypothetical protein n=1 Tax=Mangrovimonas futianensis TaxID=2895523 RepID=UPI001E649F64|nr:hypothetical protein [Mangrovimonas futianensis]MCF1422458.1 hypothetical protein [Mangrovimonas futianensis]
MNLRNMALCTMFFWLIFFKVRAQENSNYPSLKPIEYKENVRAPFSAQELGFLEEVYGEYLDQVVINNNQKQKEIKNLLRNRIEYLQINDASDQKKCEMLSEVSLFDAYNKNLTRDKKFNQDLFNPLKYNFNFYSRGSQMYRVDGTNYFILIRSQYNY